MSKSKTLPKKPRAKGLAQIEPHRFGLGVGRWVSHLLGQEGAQEYLRRVVSVVVSGNGDAHLKNWSWVYQDRVSPAWNLRRGHLEASTAEDTVQAVLERLQKAWTSDLTYPPQHANLMAQVESDEGAASALKGWYTGEGLQS